MSLKMNLFEKNIKKNVSKRAVFSVLCIFYFCSFLFTGAVNLYAAPVLHIEKDVYNFGTILEGTVITHDFVIENTGNEPLLIPNIRSTCACAVADYTEKILPGEKGTVTVEFDSKGSGGRTVNYKIRGDSSDPDKENFDLAITGYVEPILIIEPERAKFTGNAGETVTGEIIITHDKRHPLKILSASTKKGNVSVKLEEIEKNGEQRKYKITVTSLKKEKGKYSDYIALTTDSEVFPDKQIIVKIEIR